MDLRKKYFVSIIKEEITQVSVPDSDEFEIRATDSEIEKLNDLFKEKNKHEKNAVEFLAKPFNEWGADEERASYDAYLTAIYDELYKLGTPETQEKIKSMRIKE